MSEYLIQQPKSLEHLAIPKIGDWIASQAKQHILSLENKTEDVLSDKIEVIRYHLDRNVPYMLHDNIVIEAMRALKDLLTEIQAFYEFNCEEESVLNNNIIGRMTETFLYSENLTSLLLRKIGTYVPSFTESYRLAGLTKLEIRDFEETEVMPLLKELHNLKVFQYWYYCTKNVLSCLVDNCKLIEALSLSDINDQGIHFLTLLPNLRVIIFSSESSISQDGVETLLLSCKKIEVIHFLEDDVFSPVMENVLKSIISSKSNAGKHFNLKSLGGRSVLKDIQVVQMCPLLEVIRLDGSNIQGHNLNHIHDFQKLRKLELKSLPICADVKNLLQAKGRYLIELKINGSKEITLNELMCINQMCPNLEGLTIHIYEYYLKPGNLSTEKTLVKNIPHLGKLKTLSISGQQLTDEALFFILSSCPKVESVLIGKNILLNDDIMLRVLEKNPLSCLKRISIYENRLSMFVIDLIVQSCTGLKVLETFEPPEQEFYWDSSSSSI